MPHYFFDTDDGERRVRDDAGIDLASASDVPRETQILLYGLGVAEMLNGRNRVFTAVVRNAGGTIVYKGTTVLTIQRPCTQT